MTIRVALNHDTLTPPQGYVPPLMAGIELPSRVADDMFRAGRYAEPLMRLPDPELVALLSDTLRNGSLAQSAQALLHSLRAMGLTARYVSGYLDTEPPPGQPRMAGAPQYGGNSHTLDVSVDVERLT